MLDRGPIVLGVQRNSAADPQRRAAALLPSQGNVQVEQRGRYVVHWAGSGESVRRLSLARCQEGGGPMSEAEPASAQIGQKATEMATQIELTARDLVSVGHEATALAGALVSKVTHLAGTHTDAEGSEISQQAHDLAGEVQKTTTDAVRIAQKAVEMASKIAKAPSAGSGTPPGEELKK